MAVNTIKFSEFDSGGDLSNNNITVGLSGGGNKQFNNPWTFLPPGTTAERPSPSSAINYRLRFNTDDQLYEYYDAVLSQWTQLQESLFTAGPFVIYEANVSFPDAFNLGSLNSGILKQTVSSGISTPAIAILDTDYYGPGMTGYLQSPAGIKDINGNIVEQFNGVVSAVNYLVISNSASGQTPSISSAGSDSNIGVLINGKGTGLIEFRSENTTTPFVFYSGTSAQHTTNFSMADTSAIRNVTWQDSDGTVAWLSDVMNTVQSLTGTQYQILVNGTFGSPQIGNITLTTPQNIDTTSSPQFVNLTMTGGQFLDASNNVMFDMSSVASSVNHLRAIPSVTGFPAQLSAVGSDTNVGFVFRTQATGAFEFITQAPTSPFTIYNGTLSQHTTIFSFANTAASRTVTFQDASGTLAYLTDIPSIVPAALTKTDDTNVTLTLGGSPSNALLQATSLTLGWTGQLGLIRGGTNASLTASNGGIVYSTASALAILAGTATANQVLLSGSSTTPAWSTATYPSTTTINQLLYSSSANTITGLATANNGILVTSSGGVPSIGNTVGAGLTMPSITFNSTSGIIGTTTNNNAAAGSVGEWQDSGLSGFANWASTTTVANLQSLSLTAGDWDVYGIVINSASSAASTLCTGALSLTSATITPISSTAQFNVTNASGLNVYIPNFTQLIFGRVSIASTTTVYLVGQQTYSVGSPQFAAGITARRVR